MNCDGFIKFKDVYKAFNSHKVLDGVSIGVCRGETITIIGGSGIGKSVFLKLLLGVIKPDSGHVFYNGDPVNEMPWNDLRNMRKKIGMLFQGAALFDSLTVAENVAYPLREFFDYPEDKIDEIVNEKLKIVGLEGINDMVPSDLSGGMKKRVGLARAIATNPEVILYDEPTTGLDPANATRICNLIVNLQERFKVTSVVVTHEMQRAFEISDRLALIHNRNFRFIGTPDEAKSSSDSVVQDFINGKMETGE
ncbi:MAG: ATP-binding cassette domain-containing protein [Pseudomonadota bacterium]